MAVFLRSLVVAVIAVAGTAVWFRHFDSSFHIDDFPAIVHNAAVHSLSSVPSFFTEPKIYDALPRYNSYRPLLFTLFAYDYRFLGANPHPFQFDTFCWFGLQVILIYFLFRLLVDGNHYVGLFAATLYGLHPALADTVNYTLQRGEVIAGVGITGGLLLWIVWPRLPADLNLMISVKGVSVDWRDLVAPGTRRFVSGFYRLVVKAASPLYLFPVIIALLVNPASAVFVLLLLAYMWLYEPESHLRRMIPVAVLCAGYWVFQAEFTKQFGKPSAWPAIDYWLTQPWVAMHYFGEFFAPVHLTADSDLQPLAHFWSLQALAGYAGTGILIWIAIAAGRRAGWQAVSLGIWWFLILLLPAALVPQQAVEADPRMYLPFAGLALATTSGACRAFERMRKWSPAVSQAAVTLAIAILAVPAWATLERNRVWLSEENLWADVIAKNPHNARALMNYGLILISEDNTPLGVDYLTRSAALLPNDGPLQVHLAEAAASQGRDAEAENHFRRAIALDPGSAPAYSGYSQWLLGRRRSAEALDNAQKAANIDPEDLVARRTLMDIYAERRDWVDLLRMAHEVLRLDPNDPDGLRGLRVAQTGIDEVRTTEKTVKADPTPDNYLNLSSVYFWNARYEDSIAAAREALRLHPGLAEAYFDMANVYNVTGRYDDAIAALREVLRIRPDYQMAKNNLKYELARKAANAGK